MLTGFIEFFHDTGQINFAGSFFKQKADDYKKFAAESRYRFLENKEFTELFPDIVEQIKGEIDGAAPAHKLPFPPEHFQSKSKFRPLLQFETSSILEKDADEAKAAEMERKTNDVALTYDSYGDDESD